MTWQTPCLHRKVWAALSLLLLTAAAVADELQQSALPPLPQPLTGNAVAQLQFADRTRLYSFFGLGAERNAAAISRNAYEFDPDTNRWHTLPAAPGAGRLASVAVGVGRDIFLFGGHTVTASGAEQALADVYRFDPLQQTYEVMPPLPTPVNNAVALVWQERYVLLVSGWNNVAGHGQVQWFDTVGERWLAEQPFPGTAVFGHAGGLIDNDLVVCGGAYLAGAVAGLRQYRISDACWHGKLNEKQIGEIKWKQLPTMPGPGRYRAAAVGSRLRGKHIVFVGGSASAYNFAGVGHDSTPVLPEATVTAYNLTSRRWEEWGRLPTAGMDFRGLLELNGNLVTVGGMERGPSAGQTDTPAVISSAIRVTPVVRRFAPPHRRR